MSTVPVQWSEGVSREKKMSTGRLLRAYLREAKFEWLRTLRVPMFSVPILGFPVVFYVFFGILMAGRNADAATAVKQFVHWGVFSTVAPGMLGFGIALAFERQFGLLTFKRALPMPPAAYLLSKMLMSIISVAIVMTALTVLAMTAGGLRLSAPHVLALTGMNALGTIPFCALGLFVGTWVNAQAAPAVVNVIYLPMALLSGTFFSLPRPIAAISLGSPMYYLDQLGMYAVGLPSAVGPLICAGILTGIAVLFTAISIRRLVRVG